MNKCRGFRQGMQKISRYSLKIYDDPEKILIGVLSNMVSFTLAKKLWGLKRKVKDRRFLEVGNVFSNIAAYLANVDLSADESQKLHLDFEHLNSKFGYGSCKELVNELLRGFSQLVKNIVRENGSTAFQFIKEIYFLIKIIPERCFI